MTPNYHYDRINEKKENKLMEKIDLHIHTNISDGTLTPTQVIDIAKNNKISTISITDHDTTDAYTEELKQYAKENNIKLISGVEISAKKNKIGVHVLGYNLDISNKFLQNELYKIRNSRHIYLHDVSEKLKNLGYKINTSKLDEIDTVSKAHIALDIIENIENKKLLIKTFNHIPTKGEFIETIMNENCPAYVEKKTVSPSEAANIIRTAGGKVILAHPVAYFYENNLSLKDIEELIKEIKPDGIEANYIYIDKNNNTINEIEKWNKFAKKHNLFTTIGSDYHTSDNIHPEIGLINKEIDYNLIKTDKIIENILK